MDALQTAHDHLRSLLHLLPNPDVGSENRPGFIAAGWGKRATETAIASVKLRQQDMAHVTEPLNRLVLELTASIAWLTRVDDLGLAVLAIEHERIRNLKNRAESVLGNADGMEVMLTDGIQNAKNNQSIVAGAVPEDKQDLFVEYKRQFKTFHELVASIESEWIYTAFRFTSARSHASLDIALEESSTAGNGPDLTDFVMSLKSLVTLVCFAINELSKLEELSDQAHRRLREVRVWVDKV